MDQTNDNQSLTPVSDFAPKAPGANSTFEVIKHTVADKLHTAADIVQQKVEQNQGTAVAGYASQASGWLDDAAEYVREIDPQKVKANLQTQIRSNPGRSLMVAGAVGLVLGILLRRR